MFRCLQGVNAPIGDPLTETPTMWSAYVNFTVSGGSYMIELTNFTICGGTGTDALYEQLWNSVTNDSGNAYTITQAQAVLDAIWASSVNNLNTQPTWGQ